ncbi:unnamed protein product [Rotaria magnacalcarata]|uniref:Alpha/beta hydrolase n=1 Tax=Rotaria magnacalcarata TaxID=392030 RepID=A0A819X9Y9_9BILA|nr:unnamed protein product [Rotaria magnacalcarata]CAF4134242.1 unnamed protein product [Rotaria magnacalcarata]
MIHSVIVPGVGGSEDSHWQTWLQQQLKPSSRVQQQHWQRPVLNDWVEAWATHVAHVAGSVQVIAHSFGCLTSVAALHKYPQLQSKVKNLVLVAPANPARFGENGFARESFTDYEQYFKSLRFTVPSHLLLSENDPWFALNDALDLAQHWQIQPIVLGAVGHINVASGFNTFPAIVPYLLPERKRLNWHLPAFNRFKSSDSAYFA